MLNINVLGSSSRGNCFILSDNKENLMLECGMRYEQIYKLIDKEKLKGILISHQHTDHLNQNTLKALNKPVFSNKSVIDSIFGLVNEKIVLQANKGAKIGGFTILPFLLYHDVENYGYLIKHNESGHKIVFITDSSSYSNLHFKDIDTFIVEANNSEEWLDNKEELDYKDIRNYGEFGHCSIEKTIEFLKLNVNHNTKNIILVHIASNFENYLEFKQKVKKEFPKINVIAINPQLKEPLEIELKKDIDISFD